MSCYHTSFETALAYAREKLKICFPLKSKQEETLRSVFNGNDTISVLPTGYGKSVIFQLLPWLLQRERSSPGVVLVVSPLNSLMQDQVMSLSERGIKACFLNSTGTSGKTYKMLSRHVPDQSDEADEADDQDSEDREQDIYAPISVKLAQLKTCQFELIYAHPETLLQNRTIGALLRSDIYKERVCAVVVDEVHMISEWGPTFRKSFKKLAELTCIFPDAAHLALTATATPQAIADLANDLQYSNHETVRINPDRPNIYLEKQTRLPNIRKYEKLDNQIHPLAEELRCQLEKFPLTVVYINHDESLGYCYQYVARHLQADAYLPKDNPIPENRIFAQYHRSYTEDMKNNIVSELRKEKPKLRLVMATVALGMGLNAPHIRRVIHFQPPTTMEKYFQEIGRAGRDGQPATALMYFNKNDIAKNRKGLSDVMTKYCENNSTCLRKQLVSYFGFDAIVYSGNPDDCCINCRTKNAASKDEQV